MRPRTASTQRSVPGRYGPYGELFFFFLKKEPMVLGEWVRSGPSIGPPWGASLPSHAEAGLCARACALIGLPMMSVENSRRSDSGSYVSSRSSDESNVGNDAKESCGAQFGTRSQGISPASPARVHVRVNRVDVDTCWFRKSCRLLWLPCPSFLSVVSMCLHVLRQFHHEWGQMTTVTAINVVLVSEEVCAGTTRSGACGLNRISTGCRIRGPAAFHHKLEVSRLERATLSTIRFMRKANATHSFFRRQSVRARELQSCTWLLQR